MKIKKKAFPTLVFCQSKLSCWKLKIPKNQKGGPGSFIARRRNSCGM
jgi:hypothetical protein